MKHDKLVTLLLTCLLILGLLITGCTPVEEPDNPDNTQPPSTTVQEEITLYFGDSSASGLVAEKRMVNIENSNELASAIVKELIMGPEDTDLQPTIPPETELLSLKVEDGTALVDFSEDIITKHWGGSAGETMTIMSLVNSLTELNEINKVQILVEGEKADSLLGHWDTSQPLGRNESYILPPQS